MQPFVAKRVCLALVLTPVVTLIVLLAYQFWWYQDREKRRIEYRAATEEATQLAEQVIEEGDESKCASITEGHEGWWGNEDERARCFAEIAVQKNDASLCKEIKTGSSNYKGTHPYEELSSRCFAIVGVQTGNAALCEEINEEINLYHEEWYARCYAGVAVRTGDTSLCEKITELDIDKPPHLLKGVRYSTKQKLKEVCLSATSGGSREIPPQIFN